MTAFEPSGEVNLRSIFADLTPNVSHPLGQWGELAKIQTNRAQIDEVATLASWLARPITSAEPAEPAIGLISISRQASEGSHIMWIFERRQCAFGSRLARARWAPAVVTTANANHYARSH